MIFGSAIKYPDEKADLVRALLAAGYLGVVNILRPHAAELHSVITREMQSPRIALSTFDSKQDIKGEPVWNYVRRMRSILTDPSTDRISSFLRALRDTGTEAFVAFELTTGTWLDRLRRLNKNVLRFEHMGADVIGVLRTPQMWQLHDRMNSYRRPIRPDVAVNNVTDAAALATLQQLMLDSEHESTVPVVRFHTTSAALLRLLEERRPEFSYHLPSIWKREARWNAGSVFRTTEYFVLRASFEALAFPMRGTVDVASHSPAPAPSVSLGELERVWRELTDALSQDDDTLTREVEQRITIGERPLREVIIDLERASFTEQLFSRYNVPGALSDLLTDALNLINQDPVAARSEVRRQIALQAHEMTEELERQLAGLQPWLDLLRAIRHSVSKLHRPLGNFDVSDARRDLGIIRWSPRVTKEDLDFAASKTKELFSPVQRQSVLAMSDLAEQALRPASESQCTSVCSVLWSLGLFRHVIDTINRYQNASSGSLPTELMIMRTAARLRSGDQDFSRVEKKSHLDFLERLVQEVAPASGYLYLGLAYVSYYVAESEDAVEETGLSLRHTWSAKSFEWGEMAAQLLNGDGLGRAFAINHCAYVGATYNLEQDRTEHYLSVLRELREDATLWHYRFADTIASAAYARAYDKWLQLTRLGDWEATQDLVSSACRDAVEASDFLATAFPYFGDPEIPRHGNELKRLMLRLGCKDLNTHSHDHDIATPELPIQPHS